MKKIIIHFLLASILVFCSGLHSAWAGSFVQRVFSDRDGLEATSIRALTLDDHGFIWAATEQGLYRVSNSKVRRIDKTGSELRLADEFLTTVVNIDRDMLLVSTNAATYLYDIAKNQFTQMGSPNLFPHFPGGVLISAARKNAQEWRLLIDNGQIYDLSPSTLTLTLVSQLPVNHDLPWRKLLSMPDGQFLVAGQFQLLLLNSAGEKVVDYQWTEPMGSILDMLEDSKQRIWIATSRGIYRLEPKTLQIFPVPELPDWSTAMAEGHNGEIWFSSRAGLLKWSPDTHQIENYQQELKTQANMETLKAILFDKSGLMWVGGSGDGLALLASQPDFILDTYTGEPPHQLSDAMVWSVFASDEGLWFGASNVSFVGRHTQKAITVDIEGLKPHESVYGISRFIDHYLLVSTTSGLFVVDKLTLKGISFAQWTHGGEALKDPLINQP